MERRADRGRQGRPDAQVAELTGLLRPAGGLPDELEGWQLQHLDARHRTQAHVEDGVKQAEACGARTLPSKSYQRNQAWLQLAALAQALTCWLRLIALDGDLTSASIKTLRYRVYSAPA